MKELDKNSPDMKIVEIKTPQSELSTFAKMKEDIASQKLLASNSSAQPGTDAVGASLKFDSGIETELQK